MPSVGDIVRVKSSGNQNNGRIGVIRVVIKNSTNSDQYVVEYHNHVSVVEYHNHVSMGAWSLPSASVFPIGSLEVIGPDEN